MPMYYVKIDVPEEWWSTLKARAALRRLTIQGIMIEALNQILADTPDDAARLDRLTVAQRTSKKRGRPSADDEYFNAFPIVEDDEDDPPA